MSSLIPSATVVLVKQCETERSLEVLLLKRNSKLATHGGAWVFPGGKIDQSDYAEYAEDFYQLDRARQMGVAQRAATREVQEESGIDLEPSALKLCSTWLTPPTMKKRFDAWFFLAQTTASTVIIDEGEIHDFMWIKPEEALAKQRHGEISLPPPTFVSLIYLSDCHSPGQAFIEMCESPRHFKPKLAAVEGGFCSLYEEDDGYEMSDANQVGKQHRLVMANGVFEYINNYSS